MVLQYMPLNARFPWLSLHGSAAFTLAAAPLLVSCSGDTVAGAGTGGSGGRAGAAGTGGGAGSTGGEAEGASGGRFGTGGSSAGGSPSGGAVAGGTAGSGSGPGGAGAGSGPDTGGASPGGNAGSGSEPGGAGAGGNAGSGSETGGTDPGGNAGSGSETGGAAAGGSAGSGSETGGAGGAGGAGCVVHVDADGSITQRDGASWATAFATVSEGILQANPQGCEVWVAEGVYHVYVSSLTDTIQLASGVDVYGGFAGVETSRTERDWDANLTVLDGRQAPGNAVRVHHVVTGADDARLDGFVITEGEADGSPPDDNGGGIYVSGVSPVIANCTVIDNSASNAGGGAFIELGAPVFEDCVFAGNVADTGGGLSAASGSTLVDRCVFHDNTATDDAAGAAFGSGNPVVRRSVFYHNESGDFAGGLAVGPSFAESELATVVHNTFFDNDGPHGGGGASVNTDYALVANNLFSGNTGTYGPDLLIFSGVSPTDLANCISTSSNFADAARFDFHLLGTSPCVDSADGAHAVGADFDGYACQDVPSVDNGGSGDPPYCDAGAFEYQPP